MTLSWARRSAIAVVISCAGFGAALPAQGPPGGRGGRGATPQPPSPQVIPRTPPVDPAALEQGRTLWAQQCVNCHGTQARGSETGPNIIRTTVVNGDRSSFTPGSVLGPFLKKGHPTQSGAASSSFTDAQIVALAHFLRHAWSPKFPASNLPGPEQAKSLAVPAEYGGGFHDEDSGLPILPDRTEPCPQESIRGHELGPLHRALKNTDLMTKRDDLKLKRCATLEAVEDRPQER